MAVRDGELVTFLSPKGPIEIRFFDRTLTEICNSARTLKARYFVMQESKDMAADLPVWGVFDMSTAEKDNPYRGMWTIRDPVKTFTSESPDPAVVWAAMQRRR